MQDARPQLAQAVLVAAHLAKRRALTIQEGERFLGAYGIPCARRFAVASGSGAARAAAEMGFPVTLTLECAGTRTVRAGITGQEALRDALTALYADADQHAPSLMFYVSAEVPTDAQVRLTIPTDATAVSQAERPQAFSPLAARLEAIVADLPEIRPLTVLAILDPAGRPVVVDADVRFDLTR